MRPHHVCDDLNVLAELLYRIKDIEKFHSAMNEGFQNQFKNAYKQDQHYIHGFTCVGENNSISSSNTYLPDVYAILRIGRIMWLP